MSRPHDRGGMAAGPIDTSEHDRVQWEKNTHALMGILSGDLKLIGGSRAAIESIPPDAYAKFSYYERWIAAMESLLIEAGVLTKEEIDRKVTEMEANS
ncbi:MAG: nitrile hydratase subunit beta [bacterium]|nr:nitrile hydratase subunit beta [bacterium]